MSKTLRAILIGALLALCATLAWAPSAWAQGEEIIASLQRIRGQVTVTQAADGETVQGRNGLLLRAGDSIVTGARARATIRFRDGSEIRLFRDTDFQVKSEEVPGTARTFRTSLAMKVGGFWGNLVKRRTVAQIGTPTATIGIKGTTLRVVEREGKARVALTEGLIDVNNEREKVEVQPGQRISNFSATDSLADKVQDIPFRLNMTSERSELSFANGRSEEVFVTVQLTDIKSGEAVRRPGPIYLRSNYDRIKFPNVADLDERGFVRVGLVFEAPEASDAKLNGNVYVWAVLDNEEGDDTSEGRILFRVPISSAQERIRVESKTGQGKRVQK